MLLDVEIDVGTLGQLRDVDSHLLSVLVQPRRHGAGAVLLDALFDPVSYTHLDVYKRQVRLHHGPQRTQKRTVAVFVQRHGHAPAGEHGRSAPVSYTHLDVYKRQRHGLVHAADHRFLYGSDFPLLQRLGLL